MMHIFLMKSKTKRLDIQVIPDAPVFYLSLSQNIGLPATPIVNVGERVSKYQLLAKASGSISANIHAPVSGIVRAICKHPSADGSEVDTIVLDNDFEDEEFDRVTASIDNLTETQIVERIERAGIVGQGGAQFPTHAKYDLRGSKIDTFIINGTECEPYLTADYALMRERTSQLFQGILIVNKILKADRVVLSIEQQNKELLSVFRPHLDKEEYKHIEVIVLPNQYPQGGELQLIKSVTGKELPRGILPKDIGVIVSNVGTVNAVYESVVNDKPLVERIITISGEKSRHYGNFSVKIGTPLSYILETQGLTDMSDDNLLILGGPMMGKNILDLSIPIQKGSSGVLFFQKKKIKRNNCISCGYCVDVCPMHLMPMKFEENYRLQRYAALDKFSLSACIECAACEYICPSNVPLMESIKGGKLKLKTLLSNAN